LDLRLHQHAVAAPRHGLDVAWCAGVVVQGLAQILDAARERMLGDHHAGPHGSEQFFLVDDSVGVAKQMMQDIESLGLQVEQVCSPVQLEATRVQAEVAKFQHGSDWRRKLCAHLRPGALRCFADFNCPAARHRGDHTQRFSCGVRQSRSGNGSALNASARSCPRR
jgi:hypothetical protein